MAKPISLMAGLLDLGKPGKDGKTQTKMAIRVTGDDLLFNPDDKPMAQAFAQAVVDQIQGNLRKGEAPDGRPLPALSRQSQKRRDYEVAQGQRGGEISERFTDNKVRATGRKNYQRDYSAAKLGTFTPRPGRLRGYLSGMLAESFFARPDKSGKGVTVYVAAKRGRPRPGKDRPSEDKSALESVFGDIPLMSQPLANSAPVKRAMQEAAKAMLGKSAAELKASALDLLKGASEALENIADLASDLEDV
jgi:hypothetical protein